MELNILLHSKLPIKLFFDPPYPPLVPFLLSVRLQTGNIVSSPSNDEEHADDVNNSLPSSLMMNGVERRILSLLLL